LAGRVTVYEVLNLVIAALGLAGGAVGFVVARAAGRRASEAEAAAADARADATSALQKSADAAERIAGAIELIASHAAGRTPEPTQTNPSIAPPADERGATFAEALAAALPPAEVSWALEARTEPGTFRLRNTGWLEARDVEVTADPSGGAVPLPLTVSDVLAPAIPVGASSLYRWSHSSGHPEAVVVTWNDTGTGELHTSRITLRPPPPPRRA
jgi:hypothetical protein